MGDEGLLLKVRRSGDAKWDAADVSWICALHLKFAKSNLQLRSQVSSRKSPRQGFHVWHTALTLTTFVTTGVRASTGHRSDARGRVCRRGQRWRPERVYESSRQLVPRYSESNNPLTSKNAWRSLFVLSVASVGKRYFALERSDVEMCAIQAHPEIRRYNAWRKGPRGKPFDCQDKEILRRYRHRKADLYEMVAHDEDLKRSLVLGKGKGRCKS